MGVGCFTFTPGNNCLPVLDVQHLTFVRTDHDRNLSNFSVTIDKIFVIGRQVLQAEGNLMAKFYIHTMSIYGIKKFSVCCHGNSFTTAAKIFKSSVSLTASINEIIASRLCWYLNYLELCYQNAATLYLITCFQTTNREIWMRAIILNGITSLKVRPTWVGHRWELHNYFNKFIVSHL